MLKIGGIEMKNQVVFVLMVGVCNLVFCLIVKEFGIGFVCVEMVSGKVIVYGNKCICEMLFVDEWEKLLSLQIFGGDCEVFVEVVKIVDKEINVDIIDINMGCFVLKVMNCDVGVCWLFDLNKIYDMVFVVVDVVEKFVIVKM